MIVAKTISESLDNSKRCLHTKNNSPLTRDKLFIQHEKVSGFFCRSVYMYICFKEGREVEKLLLKKGVRTVAPLIYFVAFSY